MRHSKISRFLSIYRNVARSAGGIVSAVGFLVLAGWLLDVPVLKSILPGLATMKANTALTFVLAGSSLWMTSTRHENQRLDLIAKACATLAVLIGLLTLSEYIFNWELGIDQLLFKDTITAARAHPGRMSPVTALNISLLGFSLLLLGYHRYQQLVEVFSTTALLISLLALMGYAYGVPSLYQFFPYSSIAIHTAFTFSILCIGILLARPEQGLIKIFSSDNPGGMLARRLMPAALVVPFLLGWLLLTGQRMGLYDSTLRLVLFALSNAIIFAILILWNSGLLQSADLKRQQAQTQLDQSEERKATILDTSLDGIITIDHTGQVLEFNPAAEKIFRYAEAEVLGKEMSQLIIPPSLRERHRKGLANYLATGVGPVLGKRIEMTGMRADGTDFPVELSITLNAGSELPIYTGFVRDITERKQMEAALRRVHEELEAQVQERTAALAEANALLQMLLDHMPDHIYFKDAQSRFIRNSRSQARALGLRDPSEAVGKTDFDFFPHAQLSYEKEQEIIRSGEPLVDEEERIIWPDGRETWVSTTKMPLLDRAGQIIGTFGISRDITERKRAEVAVQKAKLELEAANKELEAFSYSVSHDLRAPLRSIDGFSLALLEDYGDRLPGEGQNHLKRVRAATQRMAQLIDDLLNLSKVTRAPMKLVSVDLSQLALGITAELQRTQPERNIRCSIAPNLKSRGDPNLLQVVLVNLLNNAWKYTSKQEQAEIEFGSKYENSETIYFVRDNGAGFDMAYAGKLFGAFQRLHAITEFPGTGIGLATVQRIIHRHGGRIWAEGAVNQGATFFFTLPALERAQLRVEPEDTLTRRVQEII
jgi:PAS domain S-box-containing protein